MEHTITLTATEEAYVTYVKDKDPENAAITNTEYLARILQGVIASYGKIMQEEKLVELRDMYLSLSPEKQSEYKNSIKADVEVQQ